MQIDIPNEILGQPGYGLQPFLLDVAIMLYQQERISMAKAARMAGIPRLDFQRELADRGIVIQYDLEADLVALKKWRKNLGT